MLSQTRVSVGTDISFQRNLKKDQRFWTIGQTVTIDWHFTPKEGAYALVCYYSNGHFKRLTIDLGLGWEIPLGGDIFIYSEGKAWIPTTEYPSKYLFVNNNAPLAAMISAGLRILF